MKRLRLLTLFTLVLATAIFFLKKRNPDTIAAGKGLVIDKQWLAVNKAPLTPKEDVRPADQTFLTFPEWFLVFSPEEQAAYFKTKTATGFPYMAHTAQIWQSYSIVKEQIKDNFPYNCGYHFMIWVIGSSASVEYSIKAWYETLIGRLTDTGNNETEEDYFNARYTRAYVDFIKDRPWYEFDFKTQLNTLWRLPLFSSHWVRKLERRYILTSELLVKIVYGKLIGMGTQTVYEEALPTTAVLVDSLPGEEKEFPVIKKYADGSALLQLPRYDRFNPAICSLAEKGYDFKEIAGNTSAILLTVITPASQHYSFPNATTVFTQPLASDRSRQCIAIATRVGALQQLLMHLRSLHPSVSIEHVFDF